MMPTLPRSLLLALAATGALTAGVSAIAGEEAKKDGALDVRAQGGCISGSCHGIMGRKRFVHGPVAREACRACHAPKTEVLEPANAPPGKCISAWKLARPAGELCRSCHEMKLKNVGHVPAMDGKCTSCHDPHESAFPSMLRKDPTQDLCFDCHDAKAFRSKAHVHGPVSSGACILCHEAHSSWNMKLLVKTGADLCLTCHEDVAKGLRESRHIHPPVEKDCGACHDPHASDVQAQLREPVSKLCTGCHRGIQDLVSKSAHVHGALGSERSCLACHSGHSSNLPKLLSESPLDSCLRCHDRPVKATDGKELADIARLLRENPDHHGPIRRADCSGCHDPHASPNFRLLVKEYPPDFYLPEFSIESYDLCFQCHMKELVLVERGPGVTRFQQGDRNLHFVHVNRKKGRTCRACHAVHASRNPQHMQDTFEFGSWKDAPLNFKPLPRGGSCAPACHKEVTYERGSDAPVPSVK